MKNRREAVRLCCRAKASFRRCSASLATSGPSMNSSRWRVALSRDSWVAGESCSIKVSTVRRSPSLISARRRGSCTLLTSCRSQGSSSTDEAARSGNPLRNTKLRVPTRIRSLSLSATSLIRASCTKVPLVLPRSRKR